VPSLSNVGIWYQARLTPEEDETIQRIALELAEKNELFDTRRKRFVKPVEGRIPTYAVTKYALHLLIELKGNGGLMRKKREKARN